MNYILVLILTLPNGTHQELVENSFTTKAACEERANFYYWNLWGKSTGSYVNGAVCLPVETQ